MAGLLLGLIPAVGEAATTIGLGVSEATGSTFLGTAAQGTFLGSVASAANQVGSQVVDTIFGTGTTENFETKAQQTFSQLLKTGYLTGNTNSNEIVKNLISKDVDIPKEISGFVNTVGDGIKNNPESDPTDIIKNVSESSPLFWYLGNQLLEVTSNFVVPNDELYLQVASIYDASNFYNTLTQFDVETQKYYYTDEIGNQVTWDLAWNTYRPIPTLFGVYVGYSSRNNDYPLRYVDSNGVTRESILDRISMSHDEDYKIIGLFSKFADYKLIARIQAQKENMTLPNERQVANVAVSYFSTLGNITRKFFGVGEDTEALVKKIYREIKNEEISDEQVQEDFNTASQAIYTQSSGSTSQLLSFINGLEIQLN